MPNCSRHQILLVDDEASVRNTLAMLLASIGYDAATAKDGFEALLHLKRGHPALTDRALITLHLPLGKLTVASRTGGPAVLAACICTGSAAHLILDCGELHSFHIVLQIVGAHSHNRRLWESRAWLFSTDAQSASCSQFFCLLLRERSYTGPGTRWSYFCSRSSLPTCSILPCRGYNTGHPCPRAREAGLSCKPMLYSPWSLPCC